MKINENKRLISILCAEDDAEDRMFIKDAWKESLIRNKLDFVEDGEELMDYLLRRGKYADMINSPLPGMILLDLNMPRKDGREAIKEIKSSPDLRRIPIVVLTTSKAEEDIVRTYDLGVSGYVAKPVKFESLVNVMKGMKRYWLEVVELPIDKKSG